MNIEKRLAEIKARRAEIRSTISGDANADLDALEKELRDLADEESKLEKRLALERMLGGSTPYGDKNIKNHV